MKSKIKTLLKRVLVIVLCIASLTTTIVSAIPTAEARGSSDILGTNTALGSPILNETNFNSEDWNYWETICWGVFLSNFCQPLIDTYESAFREGKGGSDGAGFNALWGGSGSDRANAKVIKALCDYAIDSQKKYSDDIYISYTPIEKGKLGVKGTPNGIDKASFKDIWLVGECDECNSKCNQHSWAQYVGVDKFWKLTLSTDFYYWKSDAPSTNGEAHKALDDPDFGGDDSDKEYDDITTISYANLPTLYVKRGSEYVVIWDYTDWWDIQVISAITNSVNETYGKDFINSFSNFWSSDSQLALDPYGNIVIKDSGRMVVPAAVNQHITGDKSINMLNSWMMNSYVNTVSSDSAVLGLRQTLQTLFGEFAQKEITNGYPAFGTTNIGNIGLFYYDLDSIYVNALKQGKSLKYGDALLELFNLQLDNDKTSTIYPIKFEIAGGEVSDLQLWGDQTNTTKPKEIIATTNMAAAMLPNLTFEKGKTQKNILSQIIKPDGKTIDLFSTEPIAIAVKTKQSSVSAENKEVTNQGFIRRFYNYLYQCYAGNINEGHSYTANNIITLLSGVSWSELCNSDAFLSDGGKLRQMMYNFTEYDPDYEDKDKLSRDWEKTWDYGNNESADYNTNRIVLAYMPSTVMVEAAKILGIKDGAEFSTYCTYIYMTYLDFYGVSSTSTLTETSYNSRFDSRIYMQDENGVEDGTGRADSILIKDIGKALNNYGGTFEHTVDIEQEVLQYSYLMLSPTEGRDYRKSMIEDGMADWIYEQYNKIVYGGSGEYAGSASKYRSGFLAIENYSDNFFTSWFLEYYVDIVVWAIMIGILLVIIVGLIKGKKLSWFFISSLLIINGLLLVPSVSEIVPYFTSSITQNMFTNKMTYWSISQGVTNSSIERDLYSASRVYNNLSVEDAEAIADIVKSLSVVQTDTSLSVKQDISQKVTQKLASGVWSDIESYQSARWILPMVMQQFTSDDMSADYIYKPLANIWDDLSNIYWYFNPENAVAINKQSPTLTSYQTDVVCADKINDGYKIYNNITNYFPDVNTSKSRARLYYFEDSEIDYRSSAYKNDNRNLVHLVCYYLDSEISNALVAPSVKRQDITSSGYIHLDADDSGGKSTWKRYIEKTPWVCEVDIWKTNAKGGFETTADSYERDDRDSITSDMPYLLSTESPIYYFYSVVKDSFDTDITLGGLIAQLQGQTDRLDDGSVVRENFMYAVRGTVSEGSVERADLTPYVKDILDLEEMFYNMIPYMYQMQLTAGGFDGESGVLVEDDCVTPLYITDELNYYEGTLQSWMYRCNWATKIMENPNFEKSCTVRDKDGKEYTVANPLLWECYPENRPMVFSEAQKQAMGLEDRDLNIIELKCIEVNEKVAKQWTLLVNYAGTAGITTEVLMRQMATDATLIFCQEFSSSGLLDTTYEIYPQSLDLRYISFDSIMKMLIMNVSKDTSYIYGDTMLTVISNSDIFTSILLLIAAVLCALVVPLARCFLLALIFYLGFLGVFKVILHDNKTKSNVACGQLISNGLFMLYTIIYFFCFYLMMNLTSSDEVLTVSNIKAEAGNPVWVLLIVILLSGLYIFIMIKHIIFCWTNRADMGFAAYSQIAGNIVGAVRDSADKAKEGISNFFNKEEVSSPSTTNTNSISGTGFVDNNNQSSDIRQESINTTSISEEQLNSSTTNMDLDSTNGYNMSDMDATMSNTDSDDINAEIEAGKLVEDES